MKILICAVSLLLSYSWTLAQVEFDVETHPITSTDPVSLAPRDLNDEEKVVADFLYLTQKEEFCISEETNLSDIMGSPVVIVCVFPYPGDGDTQHLYVGKSPGNSYLYLRYVVFYEGRPIAVLNGDKGIANLDDGEYMLYAFYNASNPSHTLVATVSFSLSSEGQA